MPAIGIAMWYSKVIDGLSAGPQMYYIVESPEVFYEYRFLNRVPRGTQLHKRMPPLIALSDGKMIGKIHVDPSAIVSRDGGNFLHNDVNTLIEFEVGSVSSPQDILLKLDHEQKSFDQMICNFREALQMNKFVVSSEKTPKLYQVVRVNEDTVEVFDFGPIHHVVERIQAAGKQSQKDSAKKKGKAFEWADNIRLRKILTLMLNKMPLDSSKIEFAIRLSGIKPEKRSQLETVDFLCRMDPRASTTYERLAASHRLEWLTHAKQFFGDKNGKESPERNRPTERNVS